MSYVTHMQKIASAVGGPLEISVEARLNSNI